MRAMKLLPWFLLAAEFVLGLLIIRFVRYTEIDWEAYMDEVKGPLNGDFDYYHLEGATGPLVYPAGFVYIFSLFYSLTNKGTMIKVGQYIFLALYLLELGVVFSIYKKLRKCCPPWVLVLLCLSRRIHSIFMLRLFNDPVAMLFLYICIYFAISQKWTTASFFFSLAVSIKMNILLFFPGFLLLLAHALGPVQTLLRLVVMVGIQVLLGLPFLLANPHAYLHRAFEFTRVFQYKWSVNLQFLPEDFFLSGQLAATLLALHLSTLIVFLLFKYTRNIGGPFAAARWKEWSFKPLRNKISSDYIVYVMFTSNFVGIVFSRTLHYQFYSWYWHTLPYLLFCTTLPTACRLVLLLLIELVWNLYPPSAVASLTLAAAHLTLLIYLLLSPAPAVEELEVKSKKIN
eukprot:GILK01010203.1.p1 GENE.GILK01010203.1~~GILK01010203.1.p1  ORF type:complete len:400 (-),score=50.72 GILK01010203.1:46-1245(-)